MEDFSFYIPLLHYQLLVLHLQEFPPTSNLDPKVYGNQNSAITRDHIENNLDGWTIEEVYFLCLVFVMQKTDYKSKFPEKMKCSPCLNLICCSQTHNSFCLHFCSYFGVCVLAHYRVVVVTFIASNSTQIGSEWRCRLGSYSSF